MLYLVVERVDTIMEEDIWCVIGLISSMSESNVSQKTESRESGHHRVGT